MKFDEKNDEMIFFAEEEERKEEKHKDDNNFNLSIDLGCQKREYWKILVVDDEEDVHSVTHLTLDDFEFEDKPVKIVDAFSAEQAFKIIKDQPDIAIILLDVVMETTSAGLDLVKRIRNELKNSFVRVILRTGQPGHAPEREVVLNYDINDYKAKTELTADKIFTLVTSGLRAYKSLVMLESFRRDLEEKVAEAVDEVRKKDHIIIKQSRQNVVSDLLSNIAHQWRQPLNNVMALIQSLEYEEELNLDFVHKQTSRAMQVIQEMSETIDELRFFFEPVEEKEVFDPDIVIKKCVKLLTPTLKENGIEIEIENIEEVKIDGYQNDYAQVLLQIINNSQEALLNADQKKKWIKVRVGKEGDRSKVEIIDNGGGIAEEIKDHIFEPYVTSKFKSPGKGLSLFMCKIIIEKNMKGILEAETMDNGAIFKIVI